MQAAKPIQFESLPPVILKYIKEMEEGFNQRIIELETNFNKKIKELQFEKDIIQEKYELAMYKRFAQSAERMLADKLQPKLFDSEEIKEETKTESEETEGIKSYKRRKNPGCGRKAIDPGIPRKIEIKDIPESEKICGGCKAELTKIGEESNEKIEITPPKIEVIKTVRPKYACRRCEGTSTEFEDDETGKRPSTVKIAPLEPSIMPKGIATPSLLSTVFIQKFEDHLPFYRQEKIFKRIMVTISRQDMSNWLMHAYSKIKPIFILLKIILKSGPVMQVDETVVQVFREIKQTVSGEEKRADASESRMWLARGGPPDKPVALYQYRQTRSAEHAKEILEGFSGYLQTDGYIGYDSAVKDNDKIIHVSCFAHARRKFFEAAKISKSSTAAEEGIKYIKRLYEIESKLRAENKADENDGESKAAEKRERFLNERKEQVRPVFNEFKQWLMKIQNDVAPRTLLGEAVGYALKQWEKLIRYIESPYLTPDTNSAENLIRPFVVGRNAWMFCGSPSGADSSCGMYTLIQTAKLNGIEPFKYLKTLFEKTPYASSVEDWEKLLPWNIHKS